MEIEKFFTAFELPVEKRCQLDGVWDSLIAGWNGEMSDFLSTAFFKKYYPHCAIAFPLDDLLLSAEKVIEIAAAHPEAALLAHAVRRCCFELEVTASLDFLPDILPFFGEEYSGMFALMITMGCCPYIEKSYAALGLPEHYAFDTMKWIGGSMNAYAEAHGGRPGRPFHFSWLRHYMSKKLFRIGRLEYLVHPAQEHLPLIYRNRAGQIAVLAQDKWMFRSDMYRTSDPQKAVFTAAVIEKNNTITGTPVFPDGRVDFNRTLTLDKEAFFPVVSPWDICPSLHIPGGSRLSFDEVKSSLSEAVGFFEKYLHREVPLFSCCSWILNPVWEELLENSNMARFRQECYAVPGPDWGAKAGMTFIFGRDDKTPDMLPQNNSVQKAFARAFALDKTGIGTIFVLREDIPSLGNTFYRSSSQKSILL